MSNLTPKVVSMAILVITTPKTSLKMTYITVPLEWN